MRALLRGVRGSTAASGADFVAVGGHTSCVAIPAREGRWLVLDAGTGFTQLGRELGDQPLRGSILLTHLHWDHTQGLPFLPQADRPDAEVDLWVPEQHPDQDDGPDPASLLARAMSPPHFPIRPAELEGDWRFRSMTAGRHLIEGFEVTAAEVHHKGGMTFGFRITGDEGSLAYVPDHSPRPASPRQRASALALIDGVDVLLHGGGYLDHERELADAYGHATIDDAVDLATEAGVGRLVVVHHSPARTDAAVAALEEDLQGASPRVPVTIGRQGDWIDVGR